MWDILEIRLFKFLSASDTEIDFELQIKEGVCGKINLLFSR